MTADDWNRWRERTRGNDRRHTRGRLALDVRLTESGEWSWFVRVVDLRPIDAPDTASEITACAGHARSRGRAVRHGLRAMGRYASDPSAVSESGVPWRFVRGET